MTILKEHLIDDYNQSMAVKDIAEKYNISRPTVYKYLKEYGITPNRCNKLDKIDDSIPKEMKVKSYLDELEYSYVYNRASAEDKNVCGKYRPDFLFKGENHYVIIEVDEHEHTQYIPKCEIIRMLNITYGLGLHTIFLRFNPDRNFTDKTAITDEIHNSRLFTLGNRLDACLNLQLSDLETMPLMTVEYLFYSDKRVAKLKTLEESDLKDEFQNEHLSINDIVDKDALCTLLSNDCIYCKKTFSCKSNLNHHQSTAKYCLALRTEPVPNLKTYNCTYCKYTNNSKHDLAKHVKTCKHKIVFEKKEESDIRVENLLLKQENAMLKKQLEDYKTMKFR